MNIGAAALSIALLLGNGFFVWAEFALVAARRPRMEQLTAEGSVLARLALRSMREVSLMLSGAQLGITMCSLGLGFVAEPALAHAIEGALEPSLALPASVVHAIAVAVTLTIIVFLHMVVGEMVPKNIAIAQPERSAIWLAVPIRVYAALFRPVIRLLTALANGGMRALGVEPRDELLVANSAEEIAHMLTESREQGLIEDFEHRLLSGALRFQECPVSTVMVPRARVEAVDASATPAAAEKIALGTGHSRLPVLTEDGALGFLHVKDLLGVGARERDEQLPRQLVRWMPRVPASSTLPEVLREMQRDRTHFALVTGEDGRVAGIVTLEDVLEQLVGDIRDEHDVREAERRRARRQRGGRTGSRRGGRRATRPRQGGGGGI